ncbi:tRNA (adenosine(37)-N6)-threonylcarbamoyltransferase complex transferase subunit TsaD [Candidatus Shikimatogenerans bostrichidophilus]|uniref:tRNA (adenosine(37)-N6)-threonylcarbamoyltransferase complex transferase subunit TsaD n=1 Tax=Candidatus Shikimatogenerans bostrichidophilus TaxID=2943807 RepID=UPI002966E1D2
MIKKIFNKKKIIIGIETSFDDTSASVIKGNKVLSNIIKVQKIHNKYNGVIPNIASNMHLKNIYKVVNKAIKNSKIKNKKLINGIAFTCGPGLINSLIIGENFAKSMALSLNIPLFGVNHIQAHILSIFLYKKNNKYPKFPYICLSISGGHTKLFIVKDFFKIKIKGKTLDDSLGDLIDKISNKLGFNYCNGAEKLNKYCKNGRKKYKFPIPKVKKYNFSFSGLKTYLFNFINNKKKEYIKKNINNISKSLHYTIYKILIEKIEKLIKKTKIRTLLICGGVSCNTYIRKKIKKYSKENKIKLFYLKNKKYIRDNGAMIALVGYLKDYYKIYDDFNIKSNSKLKIDNY